MLSSVHTNFITCATYYKPVHAVAACMSNMQLHVMIHDPIFSMQLHIRDVYIMNTAASLIASLILDVTATCEAQTHVVNLT